MLLTRAVIYSRVPTLFHQQDLFSQVKLLNGFARKFKLPIDRIYMDVGNTDFSQMENKLNRHTILVRDVSCIDSVDGYKGKYESYPYWQKYVEPVHGKKSNIYIVNENIFSNIEQEPEYGYSKKYIDGIPYVVKNDDEQRVIEIIKTLKNDDTDFIDIANVLNIHYGNKNRGKDWTEHDIKNLFYM
jgi:hypothetical protein